MKNKFGKLCVGEWYGVSIGFTSSKNIKGIMRLDTIDEEQDMLVFEKSEHVGYSRTDTSFVHVLMKDVSMIIIDPICSTRSAPDVAVINKNPNAIAWQSARTYRNEER